MLRRIFFFLSIVILYSCEKNEKQPDSNLSTADSATRTIEEKKIKGDTTELPAEQLVQFLPTSFDSYTKVGEPTKDNKKDQQFSWSLVQQTYQNGDKTVKVTIADYNHAYGLYAGATAIISSEFNAENEDEKSEVETMKNGYNAWVSYQKKSHEAHLLMGVADRFLISVEAFHQDNKFILNTVVNSLDLESLSKY